MTMPPQPPPRAKHRQHAYLGNWELLRPCEIGTTCEVVDAEGPPAVPARGGSNFVMYPPHEEVEEEVCEVPEPVMDIKEELRTLVAVQEEVEAVRRAELDACKRAEADPGPPLGPRGLWTMHKYTTENKTGYPYLLLEHIIGVVGVVMKADGCAVGGIELLEKFVQDALGGLSVRNQLLDAFACADHTVIIAACAQWVETIATTFEDGSINVLTQQEVLAWVRDGEQRTSLVNVSIVRLYNEILCMLQKAATKHLPVLQMTAHSYQQAYDALSVTLKETQAELTSVSKVLGSLRTGMAAEASKLGVVQRQLGTLPTLQSTVDIFPADKVLPHEWDKDSTFHLRSKYTKAKGANRALYATGDEVLFTHKELTSIAILQACCMLIAPGYDVDDYLSSESLCMEDRVRNVLHRVSATWGDLVEAVLPGGRVSPHTYENTYSVAHLISRLPAVKLVLSNLIRVLKGDKPQQKEVLSLAMLDKAKVAELQMKENLSYILEQCRHHVSTYCAELVCLYNWLVAVQAIADIAIRTTPEEEEVARLTQLVNKYKAEGNVASGNLTKNSIALSRLMFVVGSAGTR